MLRPIVQSSSAIKRGATEITAIALRDHIAGTRGT